MVKIFFFQPGSGAHPALCLMGTFKGVKCLGCDSDQEPPSTTNVKNEWNYNSVSQIYQHSMDRDICSSSNICSYSIEVESTEQPHFVVQITDRTHFILFLLHCSTST